MANRAERRKRKFKLEEFEEQAIDAMSQLATVELEVGDAVFKIPHPMLVNDEAQARIESFQAGEDLDKDEDGKIIVPHRIKGELAEPDAVRFARALMGDEEHKRFIAAGGYSNAVQLAWNFLISEQKKREDADPK